MAGSHSVMARSTAAASVISTVDRGKQLLRPVAPNDTSQRPGGLGSGSRRVLGWSQRSRQSCAQRRRETLQGAQDFLPPTAVGDQDGSGVKTVGGFFQLFPQALRNFA